MADPRLESVVSSLERELAKERAVLLVNESVEAIVDRWDELASRSEDDDPHSCVLDYLRKLRIDVQSLPTWPAAVILLETCLRKGQPPEERPLTTTLAPWTSRF